MRRIISHAASIWAVVFGAPHLWWVLGVPFGFPGGRASYDFFMGSAWRVVYDVAVVAMSVLAVLLPQQLLRPSAEVVRRWIPVTLVWIAFTILTLRGVAGLIVDRGTDLVWDPLFTIGGILFGCVAWMARQPRQPR